MKRMREKTGKKIGNRRAEWLRRTIAICMSILVLCSSINLEVFASPAQSALNREEAERKAMDEELEVLKEKQRKLEEEYKKEREEQRKEEEEYQAQEKVNVERIGKAVTADVPVWSGEVADSYAGGSGTEEDPYQISCVEELALMLEDEYSASRCYILTKDIYINEGNDYKNTWNGWAYSGGKVFDGNGYTIYGLCNSRLFSRYYSNTIKNLTIRNAYYSTADYGIGLEASEKIDNCHIYGEVNIESTNIYNISCMDVYGGTIKNCSNHMNILIGDCNIKQNERISVAVFECGSGWGEIIDNCENYGDITVPDDFRYSICGIAYYVKSISNCRNYGNLSGGSCYGIGYTYGDIENCNNMGNITSTDGNIYGIGEIHTYDNENGIKNCTNSGNLMAVGKGNDVWGIGCAPEVSNCINSGNLIGNSDVVGIGGGTAYGYKIINCKNYGNLSGGSTCGVCGWNLYRADYAKEILIQNCENYGELIASDEAAGIMSRVFPSSEQSVMIDNCVNEGNITVNGTSGNDGTGIIGTIFCDGALNSSVCVKNCENRGNITAVCGGDAYGIVGYCAVYDITSKNNSISIMNCSNSGTLLASSRAAGIAGSLCADQNDKITVDFSIGECYNIGDVTVIRRMSDPYGLCMACGIICFADGVNISNCHNSGKVYVRSTTNSGDLAGFVGHMDFQKDEQGNEYYSWIENCYNIGEIQCDIAQSDGSSNRIGRLIDYDREGKTEINNLYNLAEYSQSAEKNVTYLTKQQMKEQSNFEGFDFNDIWQMGDRAYPYPVLKNTPIQATSPDDLDMKVSDGETAIQVTDPKGHAIKGAIVKSTSTAQEQETTDTGLAKFTNLSGKTETFTVTAAGYPSQTESFDLEKCGHLCKIVMVKDGLSKVTLTYNGNKYNLLVEEKKINEADKSTKFQIQCEAVENTRENIEKYTIEQEKKQGTYNKIAESEDGSFSLQTDKFQAGKQVYVCGYDPNNKELFRTQINLNVIKTEKKVKITQMDIGKDLSFTIGDDVPVLGGQKITLKGITALPVYTEVNGETIKVGFNIDLKKYGLDEESDEMKWQTMKETFTKSLLGRGSTRYDNYKKMKEYVDKEFPASRNPNVSFIVAGYAEGPVTGESLTGKIYIGLQVAGSWEWQVWRIPPIVVALDVVGKVSGGGETIFYCETSDFEGNIFAEGSFELKVSGGIGIKNAGSVGAYGKGEISTRYNFIPKKTSGFEYWKLKGEVGLQVRLLGKELDGWRLFDGEYYLYKRDASTIRSGTSESGNVNGSMTVDFTDANSYTTIPHEQMIVSLDEAVDNTDLAVNAKSVSINSVSENAMEESADFEQAEIELQETAATYAANTVLAEDWLGQVAADKSQVDSKVVQTSSYIDSMPQLVKFGNDIVMLYLDDYPTRNAQNASTLMYSLYNTQDDTWSLPQAVYDDGTADYNPVICQDKSGFLVMWNNSKAAVPDGEELSLVDTAKATDLYRMTYDESAHAFTGGKAITDNGEAAENFTVENGVYEKNAVMKQIAGTTYYAWVENSAGDVFGTEGTNSIVFAKDTEDAVQTIQSTDVDTAILDLQIGEISDSAYVAYTYDEDGDLSDASDTRLIVWNVAEGIQSKQSIYAGAVENLQFDAYHGEKVLFWYADGNYHIWNGQEVKELFEEGEIAGSSFHYFTGDVGREYISFVDSDETGTNGYVMKYDDDSEAWGQPVQLTETENYIEQLNSVAWNGKILSVYNLVKANVEKEDNWVESCSLGSVLTGEYCDLSIEDVHYLSEDFQKNGEFPVTMYIHNSGTQAVDSVKVSLLNSQKQQIAQTDVEVKLLPGDLQEMECSLQLPEDVGYDTYYFQVEKASVSSVERNDSNNIYETILGMADLQTIAHLNRLNGYYSIVASVVNKGLKSGTGKLTIKNYNTGEEYYSVAIDNLDSGENYHLEIPLQNLDIPEDEENAVCVQAVSEDEQEIEGNNEAYVNIIPCTTEDDIKEPDPAPDKEEEKEPTPTPDKEEEKIPDSEKEKDPMTPQKIPVRAITISGISKKIAAGKKIQLTATITPKNASVQSVTWHSSDEEHAPVSSTGKVSLKRGGVGRTVTIAAKARDGSNVKATYRIKIMDDAVKKVTIKTSSKTVKPGKSLKLKAVVKTTGDWANTKIQWTSSNTKYATVSSKGVVKAKKAGKGKTVKITAKATDGSGKKATIKIKIQ